MSTSGRVTGPLGAWGEQTAVDHLRQLGWQILDRNWRCPSGELDVVARDLTGTVVVVEVKARSGLGFGDPLEAITHAKVAKLRALASLWLREHPQQGSPVRLDAVGVLRGRDAVTLTHLRGIAS
jgi:putative endonuclease